MKIGNKIRMERKARGLSIRALAEKVGVNAMTLQRIETNKTSPSVAILSQIAQYLLQPIDFFIKEENPNISIAKGGNHQAVETDNMRLTMIAPLGFIEDNILINVLESNGGSLIDSHTEEGYSFAYILEGTAIFKHEGVEYRLEQGDTLYYNASFPHSVMAVGKFKSINIFFKGKR